MMGHVMNLLVRFVVEQGGPAALEQVRSETGLANAEYRFEEIYPEEEFQALVGATLAALKVGVPQLEKTFAAFFMRVSPEIFPAVFELSEGARGMILKVPALHQSIPSAASRQLFKDKLLVVEEKESSIVLRYDSPHRLCCFLQHVCAHVFEFYGETGRTEEHQCAREGADACLIEVYFDGPKHS